MKLFIVFEGLDGSGKSTQIKALNDKLKLNNYDVISLREPGSTEIGDKVLEILESSQKLTPIMEFLLFSISRSAIINEKIMPNLNENKIVLCDRYFYSSIAYQGSGRNLDNDFIHKINNKIVDDVVPDIVFYFDLTWEEKIKRKGIDHSDRFEKEDKLFHENVRKSYLQMAETDSTKWIVIDATLKMDEISEIIYAKISDILA
ncbi:MAG: dTMP kinase [Dehalococcoidia bacterium]